MNRKKWTPKTDITEADIRFKEKRKWQIALRRYLLDKQPSAYYAPYFGLDIETFREWIAVQFDKECNWENFSKNWQLELIIPASYFDFNQEEDLKLAWNFINIRVDRLPKPDSPAGELNLLSAKKYFSTLFKVTGFETCQKMVQKIKEWERVLIQTLEPQTRFIAERLEYFKTLSGFNQEEMLKLNEGMDLELVIEEAKILKKMGY